MADKSVRRSNRAVQHRQRRNPVVDRHDSEGRPVGIGGAARQRSIDAQIERMVRGQSSDSNN